MLKNKKIEVTKEGLESLKIELNHLKSVRRPEVITIIDEARKLGDLSENADYHSARELQAQIESEISKIQNIIDNAKIVKISSVNNQVTFGKVVKVLFVEKNREAVYKLVGKVESNPLENRISVDSPIGKSVLGKEVGERVLVQLENGKQFHIEILEIVNEKKA